MTTPNSEQMTKWLQDVLKYLIGGTIAAGLVTFIGFLTWRGGADAKLDSIKEHVSAIEKRLDTLEGTGSVPVQVLIKTEQEQDRRLQRIEAIIDERTNTLALILKNQDQIINRLDSLEKWKRPTLLPKENVK